MTPVLQSYMENQLSVKKIILYMTGSDRIPTGGFHPVPRALALVDVIGEIFMTPVLQSYMENQLCQENSSLYDRIPTGGFHPVTRVAFTHHLYI